MAGSFMACVIFFFSSRIRHTRYWRDWSSDVCSSDLTRAYRHGDDLRKVHWRATARTGEPTVRLEERPWRGPGSLPLVGRPRPLTAGPPTPPPPSRKEAWGGRRGIPSGARPTQKKNTP